MPGHSLSSFFSASVRVAADVLPVEPFDQRLPGRAAFSRYELIHGKCCHTPIVSSMPRSWHSLAMCRITFRFSSRSSSLTPFGPHVRKFIDLHVPGVHRRHVRRLMRVDEVEAVEPVRGQHADVPVPVLEAVVPVLLVGRVVHEHAHPPHRVPRRLADLGDIVEPRSRAVGRVLDHVGDFEQGVHEADVVIPATASTGSGFSIRLTANASGRFCNSMRAAPLPSTQSFTLAEPPYVPTMSVLPRSRRSIEPAPARLERFPQPIDSVLGRTNRASRRQS